jgi:DNA-binding transcriptional LysR family regulator
MADPFRIQQVRQFLIAAESGSFRAAAAGTFRSSAAVSTAMHDLEVQVGAALFDVSARVSPRSGRHWCRSSQSCCKPMIEF